MEFSFPLKIHGGISSISSISSARMEVDSRPSPSHFQILVLFGSFPGLFGMVMDILPASMLSLHEFKTALVVKRRNKPLA